MGLIPLATLHTVARAPAPAAPVAAGLGKLILTPRSLGSLVWCLIDATGRIPGLRAAARRWISRTHVAAGSDHAPGVAGAAVAKDGPEEMMR
jgi:hypothetical protein